VKTSPAYLLYMLRAFETQLSGQGVGTTFTAISRKDLETFVIPLPPLAEQQRIVEKVEALLTLCDQVQAGLVAAEEARQRLLGSLLQRVGAGPG
jgi:type I restriction enzyme S subunit